MQPSFLLFLLVMCEQHKVMASGQTLFEAFPALVSISSDCFGPRNIYLKYFKRYSGHSVTWTVRVKLYKFQMVREEMKLNGLEDTGFVTIYWKQSKVLKGHSISAGKLVAGVGMLSYTLSNLVQSIDKLCKILLWKRLTQKLTVFI